MPNRNVTQDTSSASGSKRGFASMPHEKVEEIARKGGEASALKAGHDEMARRGQLGGQASALKAGHDEMARRGQQGGQTSGAHRREEREENEKEDER